MSNPNILTFTRRFKNGVVGEISMDLRAKGFCSPVILDGQEPEPEEILDLVEDMAGLRKLLANPPVAGSGVHGYLFKVSLRSSAYWADNQIYDWLRNYGDECGRYVPDNEIKSAIRGGRRHAGHGSAERDYGQPDYSVDASDRAPRPQFDPEAFKKFVAGHDYVDEQWLAKRSPICPWNRTPASFLHALYRKGEKIVIFDDFKSQGQALWTHPGLPYDARFLNHFATGKRLGVWFLSNPVDGQFHTNDERKLSRRSHQNVTSWRYLVIESDRNDLTAGDWLAAIVQLPLPIAAIYETGGRLSHALLRVDAPSKEAWDELRDQLEPTLVMIGADTCSLSAVRLSRLPCCQRLGKEDEHGTYQKFADGPHLQQLLYLNAAPDVTPIAQQQVWPDPSKTHRQPSQDSEL